MTHKIIIVAFPIIKPLTVLMATNVLFSCIVVQYLVVWNVKKTSLTNEIFHEIFQTQKNMFFTSLSSRSEVIQLGNRIRYQSAARRPTGLYVFLLVVNSNLDNLAPFQRYVSLNVEKSTIFSIPHFHSG